MAKEPHEHTLASVFLEAYHMLASHHGSKATSLCDKG